MFTNELLFNKWLPRSYSQSSIESSRSKKKDRDRENKIDEPKFNLLISTLTVVVVFPSLILLMLVSLIVPQKKWEAFWDRLMDL